LLRDRLTKLGLPLRRFALVTAVTVPLTFLSGHWVRKPLHM